MPPVEIQSSERLQTSPEYWAISYDQLVQLGEDAREILGSKYPNASMRELNEVLIKPICKQKGTSVALSLNPQGRKLTVFVTHGWDENFVEFLGSIREAYGTALQKPSLWICAFALVQSDDPAAVSAQVGDASAPLEESPFVRALSRADQYLVVRNAQRDICTRLWCGCELTFAHQYGLWPNKTRIAGPQTFTDATSGVLDGQCFSQDDRKKILAYIEGNKLQRDISEHIRQLRELTTEDSLVTESKSLNSVPQLQFHRRVRIIAETSEAVNGLVTELSDTLLSLSKAVHIASSLDEASHVLVLLTGGLLQPGSTFEAELREAVERKPVVFVSSVEHGWDFDVKLKPDGTPQNELKAAIVSHEALKFRSKMQCKHEHEVQRKHEHEVQLKHEHEAMVLKILRRMGPSMEPKHTAQPADTVQEVTAGSPAAQASALIAYA